MNNRRTQYIHLLYLLQTTNTYTRLYMLENKVLTNNYGSNTTELVFL